MANKIEENNQTNVDKGLVAMFIRMSPEERLQANDNACRTILELRDAYKRRKTNDNSEEIGGMALEGLVLQHLKAWCDYSDDETDCLGP